MKVYLGWFIVITISIFFLLVLALSSDIDDLETLFSVFLLSGSIGVLFSLLMFGINLLV